MVIEEVISYDATGHDWRLYVVDYNTECMNVEMHIIPRIGGYPRVTVP